MPSLRYARSLVLVAGLATATPQLAVAQSARDRAAARSAADSGADAYEQGHYDRSLELFTHAEQLLHAPPHLLYMARSLEKLGRLVEAREAYLKIVNEQLPANSPSAFKTAHSQADNELASVEGRIAYVTIAVRGPDAKLAVVSEDHVELPAAEEGIPLPTDPGTHLFSAQTERAKSNEVTLVLRDGAKENLELVLPEPAAAPAAPAAPPLGPGGRRAPAYPDRPAPARATSSSGAQSVVGYVTLGVGAVGVGIGTYYLASYLHWHGKANDAFACDSTAGGCTADQRAQVSHDDNKAKPNVVPTIVGYSVGGAAVVTGLLLILTDHPSRASDAQAPMRALRVLPGLGSLTVSGEF